VFGDAVVDKGPAALGAAFVRVVVPAVVVVLGVDIKADVVDIIIVVVVVAVVDAMRGPAPLVLKLQYANYHDTLRAPWRNRLLRR
jgi:hypothetical protein